MENSCKHSGKSGGEPTARLPSAVPPSLLLSPLPRYEPPSVVVGTQAKRDGWQHAWTGACATAEGERGVRLGERGFLGCRSLACFRSTSRRWISH